MLRVTPYYSRSPRPGKGAFRDADPIESWVDGRGDGDEGAEP